MTGADAGAIARFGVRSRALPLPGEPDAGALALLPAGWEERGARCALLCHGGGNDRLYGLWAVARELLDAHVAVVAFNLPGHGPGGRDFFGVDRARARLDGVLALARQRLGAQRILAVGQSLGGALALDLALRGAPLAAVAGAATPLALPRVFNPWLEVEGLFGADARRALAFVAPWEALPAVGPFRRGRFPVRTHGPYVAAFRQALRALDLESRLADWPGLPALVLHGGRDGVVPCAQAHAIARAIGADAELGLVPGAHHGDLLLSPVALRRLRAFVGKGP